MSEVKPVDVEKDDKSLAEMQEEIENFFSGSYDAGLQHPELFALYAKIITQRHGYMVSEAIGVHSKQYGDLDYLKVDGVLAEMIKCIDEYCKGYSLRVAFHQDAPSLISTRIDLVNARLSIEQSVANLTPP